MAGLPGCNYSMLLSSHSYMTGAKRTTLLISICLSVLLSMHIVAQLRKPSLQKKSPAQTNHRAQPIYTTSHLFFRKQLQNGKVIFHKLD
jgi:hypothetical protein